MLREALEPPRENSSENSSVVSDDQGSTMPEHASAPPTVYFPWIVSLFKFFCCFLLPIRENLRDLIGVALVNGGGGWRRVLCNVD